MQAATLRSAPAALPWNATGRSPGLRADAVKHPETTPSHACGTVAVSGFLSRLPLRGQRRNLRRMNRLPCFTHLAFCQGHLKQRGG